MLSSSPLFKGSAKIRQALHCHMWRFGRPLRSPHLALACAASCGKGDWRMHWRPLSQCPSVQFNHSALFEQGHSLCPTADQRGIRWIEKTLRNGPGCTEKSGRAPRHGQCGIWALTPLPPLATQLQRATRRSLCRRLVIAAPSTADMLLSFRMPRTARALRLLDNMSFHQSCFGFPCSSSTATRRSPMDKVHLRLPPQP